jgi:hypothetical protein
MTNRGIQLPTIGQTAILIDAGLMSKCSHRNGFRWDCNITADRRVCRNLHNGNRTETKDSRNMADHIYRHHADDPRVTAARSAAEALFS